MKSLKTADDPVALDVLIGQLFISSEKEIFATEVNFPFSFA